MKVSEEKACDLVQGCLSQTEARLEGRVERTKGRLLGRGSHVAKCSDINE